MPAATASCRLADTGLLAVYEDLAAVDLVGAEYGARHLGAAGAHQSGEAQDLALAQREADVADFRAAAEVLHFEHGLGPGVIRDRRPFVRQRAADHHGDDLFHRRRLGGHGVDIFAVAHDRHAVGDALQLVHLVRDVDDADALRLEPANDREELVDLGVVQRRGRLVHDQHARAVGQRLGDLDHLLAGDGQPRHFRTGIELQMHRGEYFGRVGVELGVVEQHAAELLRLAADEDVLRRGEVGHQVQFLMDDADAELLGAARRIDLDRLAVEQDLAFVGLVDAGENFHQRRLAGAVLAHQRVHFAGAKLEPCIVQRPHARKRLADG